MRENRSINPSLHAAGSPPADAIRPGDVTSLSRALSDWTKRHPNPCAFTRSRRSHPAIPAINDAHRDQYRS